MKLNFKASRHGTSKLELGLSWHKKLALDHEPARTSKYFTDCQLPSRTADMAPLFVLSETSAGYVLFKSTDKKLLKRADIADSLKTVADTANLYVLDVLYSGES